MVLKSATQVKLHSRIAAGLKKINGNSKIIILKYLWQK